MYSFKVNASTSAQRAEVPSTVYWIGLSSLLADISAESLASALPVFLYSVLQLSTLQVGFLDGLYQGGTAIVQVVAAHFADRRRNNRLVAMAGYALSTLSRIGFLCSASLGLLVALASLCIDRVGKGIRTAPRDALIAAHTPGGAMGAAFGVHRAMDAMGAFAGPLVGAAILWLLPFRFDWLFAASLAFGCAGVAVFRAKVRDPVPTVAQSVETTPGLGQTLRLLRANPAFLRLAGLAVALSGFTVSDSLLYLSLQHAAGFDQRFVPLMFALTALLFLVTAAPLGRLADRIGLVALFLCGYLLLSLLYVWLACVPQVGSGAAIAVTALLGLHYAATDGVLAASAAGHLEPRVRTTGLALLSTAIGLTRIASSSLYGWLWNREGQHAAMAVFCCGMAACTGVCGAAFLLRRLRARSGIVSP